MPRRRPGVAARTGVSILNDLQTAISHYAEKVDLDPEALQNWKSGSMLSIPLNANTAPQVDDILAFGEEIRLKLRKLEQRESELSRLNSDTEEVGKRNRCVLVRNCPPNDANSFLDWAKLSTATWRS